MISEDGRYVAFESRASNLVYGDTYGHRDIFSFHLFRHATQLVSVNALGELANGDSRAPAVSWDGALIVFESEATNLMPADTNGVTDIFIGDSWCPPPAWSNYGEGWPGKSGVPGLSLVGPPAMCNVVGAVIENSSGMDTFAVLFLGFWPMSIESPWGGTLNVEPMIIIGFDLPAGGLTLPLNLPCHFDVCGGQVYLQVLQLDPDASHGVAFSPGLEMIVSL
ncbi:MAG: hypothetical protein AB1486_29495 [Planctomycetota bacterium]